MSGGIGKEGNALQAPLMACESPQSKGMCVVKKNKNKKKAVCLQRGSCVGIFEGFFCILLNIHQQSDLNLDVSVEQIIQASFPKKASYPNTKQSIRGPVKLYSCQHQMVSSRLF